jgi:hypothetical protein
MQKAAGNTKPYLLTMSNSEQGCPKQRRQLPSIVDGVQCPWRRHVSNRIAPSRSRLHTHPSDRAPTIKAGFSDV